MSDYWTTAQMAAGEGLRDVQYLSSSQADNRIQDLVKKSSDIVLATHIEPRDDMLEERRRASFDASSLAAYLNGGKEKLQRLYVHTCLIQNELLVHTTSP